MYSLIIVSGGRRGGATTMAQKLAVMATAEAARSHLGPEGSRDHSVTRVEFLVDPFLLVYAKDLLVRELRLERRPVFGAHLLDEVRAGEKPPRSAQTR